MMACNAIECCLPFGTSYCELLCVDCVGDAEDTVKDVSAVGQRWVVVYTEYGYAQVDADTFLEQTEDCQAEHALAQQPILEMFKAQHAILKAEHLVKQQALKEEQDKKAAEDSKDKDKPNAESIS